MGHPSQIPLTSLTDERNFPRWDPNAGPGQSGFAFPKMLNRRFTAADADVWLKVNKKVDRATREEYYDSRVPAIGALVPVVATEKLVELGLAKKVGDEIIVNDEDEEQRVLDALGMKSSPTATAGIPIAGSPEVTKNLADENEKLRAELAQMKAKAPTRRYRKRRRAAARKPATGVLN